jgi:uncharacterized membrane protein YidH (DUF202 family)
VSDAPAFPSDDRAWPRGAFALSVALGLAALAGSAALVGSADSVREAVGLMLVFVAVGCLEAAAFVRVMKPWLRREPVPVQTHVLQAAVVAIALFTFIGGPAVGGASLCGFLAGVFLPNASAIRFARVNRALNEEGDPRLAEEDPEEGPRPGPAGELYGDPGERSEVGPELEPGTEPDDGPAPVSAREQGHHGVRQQVPQQARRPTRRQARARAVPKVGPVLRETLAADRDRLLAWLGATVAVLVGCLATGASGRPPLGVVLIGTAGLAWVARRWVGDRLALRDFEEAAIAPRHAHVVLLHDPSLRRPRPLLGVWSEEPVPVAGRMPRAEAVYRCDRRRDALLCEQGAVVVHEAWLDTGLPAGARPRWVAADAGIALPRRAATFGRRYLASAIGAQRPARGRPLTMPAPDPTTETEAVATVISEPTPGTGPWVRLFAWRLAGLALAAVVLAL